MILMLKYQKQEFIKHLKGPADKDRRISFITNSWKNRGGYNFGSINNLFRQGIY